MSVVDDVIKKIAEQQKGREGSAAFIVGEQLKEICITYKGAAELVIQDLANEQMSIVEAEKKIKAYADSHKKGNFAFVPPNVAEDIICKFYGIVKDRAEDKYEMAVKHNILTLADLM